MSVKKIQYRGFARVSHISALALVAALGTAGQAYAAGYALSEGTADLLGNAFSGAPAKAYDASTAYSNPAGMALLQDNELEAGVSFISPTVKFYGTATDPVTGGNVNGSTGGNGIAPAASAGNFAVFKLAPDWRLGFSVTAPFGQRIAYPQTSVVRYQSLVTSVTDINFGLAISYKVNDHLSVGGGPNIDYFQARLTSALNTPLSAPTGQDGIGDSRGNSVGAGYNLGVLYKFDDATRIGFDYRSRIRHDISGSVNITIPSIYSAYSPALVSALHGLNSGMTTTITLPDMFSAGIYHQLTPRLALLGSVQWTDWGLFHTLDITPTNGSPAVVVPENWHTTWYVGVGANYQATDKLLLQTGFAYDELPVTNSNRTTRVPDANRYDLGIGAQYQATPSTTLQLAYLHLFSPGGNINNSAGPTAGTINGKYTIADNSVTAGLVTKF